MGIKKEILFDMDGTIADLYGYENWLGHIRSLDDTPYLEAKHLYGNNDWLLNAIIRDLKRYGYKIKIVTALPIATETTTEFNHRISKAKQKWLERHNFPYDEFYCVPYEHNKGNYSSPECEISILIDDNPKVRNDFLKECKAEKAKTIDATKNIMAELANLIRNEGCIYD